MAQMIFARPDGQWFDFPALSMAAMSGDRLMLPTKLDLIPLPEGATLTMMPLAHPIGFDEESGEYLELAENPYKKDDEPVYAVAALLPQGFTRLMLPAATLAEEPLPLLGYTAVGIEKGRLVVAAAATDEHRRWHPKYYNSPRLEQLVQQRLDEFPDNRIIRQLSRCALEYGCFTAQNVFYRRWEGGIPASPTCNAACLGCISEQPEDQCASPQQRIRFCPQSQEIAQLAVAHLEQADHAMVSFGQGCEGEPSLAYPVICDALREIRRRTQRGIININTNAGNTTAIRALLDAGMDSLRVSMFSPLAEDYCAYHRPKDYSFDDVCASLQAAKDAAVPVSLNLLSYPGFTDDEQQCRALVELVRKYNIRLIQFRNLNCDPRLMLDFCRDKNPMGMRTLIRQLNYELPEVRLGNYSHDLKDAEADAPFVEPLMDFGFAPPSRKPDHSGKPDYHGKPVHHGDKPKQGAKPHHSDKPKQGAKPHHSDKPKQGAKPHHSDKPKQGAKPHHSDKPKQGNRDKSGQAQHNKTRNKK